MSNAVYVSQGFIVHPHLQSIERDGQLIPVRPKTFALLLHLLEHPREVISKQALLEAVWDDVKVEEQVLVQSIRELRQLFGSAEVIQTYPRKGYAWSAGVETQVTHPQQPEPVAQQSGYWRARAIVFTALTLITLLIIAVFWYTPTSTSHPSVVIVLPVKNQVQGKDHHWIPLGAMDQVIQSLVSTPQVQVMNTEYVLNLMRHAGLPREYSSEHIARVFDVSGATLVVESELSGSVGEYRLAYRLHFPNHIKRGVLFEASPETLLGELGVVITENLAPTIKRIAFDSNQGFGNELMARAQESLANDELEAGRALLESLKQLEPDNLRARQSLITVLLKQEEYDLALREIEDALGRTDNTQTKEAGRIYYMLAVTHSKRNQLTEALAALDQADSFAQGGSDLLYQAFNAQLRGSILQEQRQFDLAQQSFAQALANHRLLRCSIGMTLTRLQMVNLFAAQDQTGLAAEHYAEAKRLVEDHQLTNLLGDLAQARELLN